MNPNVNWTWTHTVLLTIFVMIILIGLGFALNIADDMIGNVLISFCVMLPLQVSYAYYKEDGVIDRNEMIALATLIGLIVSAIILVTRIFHVINDDVWAIIFTLVSMSLLTSLIEEKHEIKL